MFQGKKKALTFSYDDGVTQDKRLVKLFNKYGLKATFNINSELLGKPGYLRRENMWVGHNKVEPEEVCSLYQGHEVAVHTLTHPFLPNESEEEIIRQVEEDRKNLEKLVGYPITGMAYPGGGINHDKRVADVLRSKTKIQYSRTTDCTHDFIPQNNPGDLLEFNPSVYHLNFDKLFELGEQFLKANPDEAILYYVWGHSYEFDYYDTWDRFEEFCKMMSGKDDIFYGTNREVLIG